MRPGEERSFDAPARIDVRDPDAVRRWAERYSVDPRDITQAVEQVGPNPTAVELWLSAPPP